MEKYSAMAQLDDTDLKILRELQRSSRISNSELARRINLSQPATHARLKRLETFNIIRQHVSLLDREQLGLDLVCFMQVRLQAHSEKALARFEETVRSLPAVLECHYLTGEFDYLLKTVFRNRQELEHFDRRILSPLPHVVQVLTSVVLSEIKSTTELPLPGDSA
ncbi:MAG: Lrp/AsnC family transcriptional regulator [Anaerolineae bacterium]|jgi:DNA-binding Lrp family transcriptional regulator|nr:Lrp/AsnC family transcriptional regulator [Anaerolineae bacterium]MBT3712792.1 Lrp/AsnC family transcriptional regulator [Anaerolineae bacterium]MBT4310167.1 Lrp/AsnC family transcriptional regulator [Anaerolineae bacterium]MBT4457198.1 Lrp/AsnC family transcriptional regulator [Anaerolineae bacterium]MBT4842758.1 Lrp/AsnC family transcriptional regulator [Anaerolineae bacterium]